MRGGGKTILYITVFICGISTMGVELSASRLLAPFFGTSLYVWTNIIGIIMVSLSIGYFIGGRISDKHPNTLVFHLFTLTAGVLIGVIPFLSSLILPIATQALSTLSYNDFLLSFIGSLMLFAVPITLLGAIIPFAVRLN
ncbi:MAG TPA: spermidine synthase, partial [Thermoplasmatales archaeon]|nr:spermidine synthase [Thermoplasmatales archaeon]